MGGRASVCGQACGFIHLALEVDVERDRAFDLAEFFTLALF